MLYNIFFEHDGGGTDWCAIYAEREFDAVRLFNAKYDGRRILRVEANLKVSAAQPEGWN